jgi:hypothetical protein
MLIFLPLLSALVATPVIANTYSASEQRTLQSAISSALHSAEINRHYQLCKEPATSGDVAVASTDKEQTRMLALLQQKVQSQNITHLLNADTRLTELVKSTIVKPQDCTDRTSLQSLLDNYEVALFALEIAVPLETPIANSNATALFRASAAQHQVQQLISSSHAIALVNVVDKQQLNQVQQANSLHPDYTSRFIFKVQHGWRSNVSQYLGMHIFVADADVDKTAKQWLVFLDKNGHFIRAISADQAAAHLRALQQPQWRYDVHGNLHRN